MSAHTPGPWITYRGHTWKSGVGMVPWPSTVVRPIVNGRMSQITLAKCDNEANARLMAAAPEMLEALRRASLALAFASENSAAMLDDYKAVSAAIAKATGGAA